MKNINQEKFSIQPLNEEINLSGVWNNDAITYTGSLIGGLSLSGSDPTSLGEHDKKLFSDVQRGLYQGLHPDLMLQQIYFHYDDNKVNFKKVDNERSNVLLRQRENYLNNKNLNGSKLFWLVESPSTNDVNSIFSASFLSHLFLAPFEKESRTLIFQKFKERSAFLAEEKELNRQHDLLDANLNELSNRLELVSPNNEKLSIKELWALCKAMVNLEPSYLNISDTEEVPFDDWDKLLAKAPIKAVTVEGMPCLKFDGVKPKYARIASAIGYGNKYVYEGIWIKNQKRTPLLQKGNYIITNKWSPISRAGVSLMLTAKANELARQEMKITSMLSGKDANSEVEKKIESSPYLRKKLDELDDAANSADRWGVYSSYIIVWDEDPAQLKKMCQEFDTNLAENTIHVVWESAGLMDLFPKLLPGCSKRSIRSNEFTTSQAGACSISYKSHEGVKTWGKDKREATFTFESRDSVPFSYTEFIGDKGLVIATGPTRSGKSFTKNCIASHFMKYGGLYQDIGVDDGAESLANFFGSEMAGIFRASPDGRGFNPFVSAPTPKESDPQFNSHMLFILKRMFELNDADDLKVISGEEQRDIDVAVEAVCKIEKDELRNLNTLYQHLPNHLKLKLDRWVGKGTYSYLFDNIQDGVGILDKNIGIYNLFEIKDTAGLAALAQAEIFYRVTRLFENTELLRLPKQLQIDECQYFLEIPGAVDFLLAKVRTWNKFNASICLWTQSPNHYFNIPDWGMLKSSATTFIFGADGQADKNEYKKVYGLSDGQFEAIASLEPRKEIFIWQREADVSKIVQLNAEPELHVIATSEPVAKSIIKNIFKQYPNDPDKAIRESIKELKLN